jgi:ribonuclease R
VKHQFVRGLMKSRARLTYEQVQQAINGTTDATTAPLLEPVITPLYGAYRTLLAARAARSTLELDLPERKVIINEKGRVQGIITRERLDSHRLIEEFMITANVAAAEALEARTAPCLYRVHEPPSDAKLESLRLFLKPMGHSLPQAKTLHPRLFTKVLEEAEGSPLASLISTVVLRSQSQACYSAENGGHFGLALTRYAHFTSPIRRYADLIVHRSLVEHYKLGEGGLSASEKKHLERIAEHISQTERRSAVAERDAVDRYTAVYLHDRVGEKFSGRVSGVTRFGLFITLDETGADGLVPMPSLKDDRYDHDEVHHCLVGRRWGRVFRLGARCLVKLLSADPLVGSTVFDLVEIEEPEENWPPANRKTNKYFGNRRN